MVKTYFIKIRYRLSDTSQTPSRHLSDTFQTPPRFHPDTFLAPFSHPPDIFHSSSRHLLNPLQTKQVQYTFETLSWYFSETFQTPLNTFHTTSRHLPGCFSQVLSNPLGGGVVGGLQVHNHVALWPNFQDRTSKNSS